MPTVTIPSSRSTNPVDQPDRTVTIAFVSDAPADAHVIRKFVDPTPVLAVQQTGTASQLEVFCSSDAKAFRQHLKSSIVVEAEIGKVSWQIGRAAILASATDIETLKPAVVDFSFYEAELRRLEETLLPHQETADADVALAYNIRESDRSHWDRLYQTMELLYRLRLAFARLEPHLGSADLSLPIETRRVFNRLLVKTRIEARLEAFSDRLETIEDLYEGAVDRITDYRNYRKGSLLEVGIIVLLLLEVVLLVMQAVHGK